MLLMRKQSFYFQMLQIDDTAFEYQGRSDDDDDDDFDAY